MYLIEKKEEWGMAESGIRLSMAITMARSMENLYWFKYLSISAEPGFVITKMIIILDKYWRTNRTRAWEPNAGK